MVHVPVEVIAMGRVDVVRRRTFRWWLGESRPAQSLGRPDFQVAERLVEGVGSR